MGRCLFLPVVADRPALKPQRMRFKVTSSAVGDLALVSRQSHYHHRLQIQQGEGRCLAG